MKAIKILGLVLVFAGAISLVLGYLNGWVNNNTFTVCSLLGMIVGIVAYTMAGKRVLYNKNN